MQPPTRSVSQTGIIMNSSFFCFFFFSFLFCVLFFCLIWFNVLRYRDDILGTKYKNNSIMNSGLFALMFSASAMQAI